MYREPGVLVEIIRETVNTITVFTGPATDAATLVQPVLDAYHAHDAAKVGHLATVFLAITREDGPRENAYDNLLTWRDTPPHRSLLLMPATWLTDGQND